MSRHNLRLQRRLVNELRISARVALLDATTLARTTPRHAAAAADTMHP